MSDYTPTTEEVRGAYQDHNEGHDSERAYIADGLVFDRWLAAHDAEVAATALETAAESIFDTWPDALLTPTEARERLTAIAAAIRSTVNA